MKILLILALVLAGVWWWRKQRGGSARTPAPRARQAAPAAQQEMLACPVCQLHVARSDARVGRQGAFYCSEEHRRQAEP